MPSAHTGWWLDGQAARCRYCPDRATTRYLPDTPGKKPVRIPVPPGRQVIPLPREGPVPEDGGKGPRREQRRSPPAATPGIAGRTDRGSERDPAATGPASGMGRLPEG